MSSDRRNAKSYLQKKTDTVLKDDYPSDGYMRSPAELAANGAESGRALGIKPFTSFPGVQKAQKAAKAAIKYNGNLKYVKHESEQDIKNFWDLLTGNYIPAFIGGTFMVGTTEK